MDWHATVRQEGYGFVPSVFAEDEVLSLLKKLDGENLKQPRAGVRHAMRSDHVALIAQDARMLEIAKRILGEAAIAFRATLFEKLPESNWLVAWDPWSVKHGVNYAHAPAQTLERILALRVHLDASTAENGPLRVLPGTHAQGVLTDDEIPSIAEQGTSVDCLMPPGGVIAMRPLVVHASSKSRTGNARRVLHIEHAASHAIADGLERAIN
jgi:hypothetical protein